MNNRYTKFIYTMLKSNKLNINNPNLKITIGRFKNLTVYSYNDKVIGYSLFTRQISKLTEYKILTCKKNFEDFKIMLDKLNLIV